MLVKIKDLKTELTEKELTVVERGLLITILLLKENDPKMTLAKVRVNININKYKEDLIRLCDKGYLEWSGYKAAIASLEKKQASPAVIRIITFMNNLYKRSFDPHSKNNINLVTARLKDFSEEEILKVVANRFEVWNNDSVMNKFLHPDTIFRESKFRKYYEEALRTKAGQKFLDTLELSLKDGDEITYEITEKLSDDQVYDLKYYNLDQKGRRIGIGQDQRVLGKELKRALKFQNNEIKLGRSKEFIYLYQNN